MLALVPVLRKSALVAVGLAAATGTAAAQGAPRAECPHASDAEKPCPQPEPPIAEQAPTDQAPVATEPTYVAPVATEPTYVAPVEEYEEPRDTLERYGIAISLGGGVSGFTDDTMRATTTDGGAWGVRVAFGTRSPIGIEAEYIGSAQSIDALGLDNNAVLIGNGLQAAARVNLLDMNVQPFLFGGIAWRHYSLTNEGFNTSAVSNTDDVLEVPLGVGIAWKYRGFMLDARGEYRYAAEEDMVPSLNSAGEPAEMHRYGVTANIGYAF